MSEIEKARRLRIGLAQINTTVGDFDGNWQKIRQAITEAQDAEVDLITFPEMAICGYPPEDLLFKSQFIEENRRSLGKVVETVAGITVIVGFVDAQKQDLYNAAALIHDTELVSVYHKVYLPNYGVFDEKRYFKAGNECPVFVINGITIGINICEDIWYDVGPASTQAYSGAEVILNISSSPYHFGKGDFRKDMLSTRASDNLAIIAYNNMVGGQDELVYDGNSLILDEKGQLLARGKQFEEDLVIVDLDVESVSRARLDDPRWPEKTKPMEEQDAAVTRTVISDFFPLAKKPPLATGQVEVKSLSGEVYQALVVGTGDYIHKNGFQKVVIGLSGGIDSSLVAVVAVDALGADNVIGVTMPSRYSSDGSISDSERLTTNLGTKILTIPIETLFQDFLDSLAEPFAGTNPDLTEENLQARIRGNLLMALSNKFGWIVLTTGNKSEMATGYTTLYGDMAGGFAVIKDVPKTMVYDLCRYRNSLAGTDLIPAAIIDKLPSAELRSEQKDSDSLPPYEVLDPILTAYVEEDKNVEQIVAMGFDEEVVKRAARLVDMSEHKRRQSPPGVKITPRAFGRDRRLPLTNRFKG